MSQPRWPDARPRPPSRGPAQDPGAGPQPGAGRAGPPGRSPRRWGAFPGRLGVCIVTGCAALGALVTAAAGTEPGFVLGAFLVAGTVCAALAVRPQAVYLIIPVPALAYLLAAVTAGLIHDHATGASVTALAVGAAQWTASGFVAMTAATALAVAITAARWRSSRGPREPGRRPPGAAADISRRPPVARGRARHGLPRV